MPMDDRPVSSPPTQPGHRQRGDPRRSHRSDPAGQGLLHRFLEVTLSANVLDRIEELVAPGITVNPDDNSYGEAELAPAARRRTH